MFRHGSHRFDIKEDPSSEVSRTVLDAHFLSDGLDDVMTFASWQIFSLNNGTNIDSKRAADHVTHKDEHTS